MRFEVPQFINIEDKLFGPFTLRQSIYLVGGGGMIFLIYRLLPTPFLYVLAPPILALTLALVFYKPNGRPFIHMMESWILYILSYKFYIWKQKDPAEKVVSMTKQVHKPFPKEGDLPEEVNKQKIKDLAWSLDVLDFDQNK